MLDRPDHISVCICTFRRPAMLSTLIGSLQHQIVDSLFTYSVVVVDNDSDRSAAEIVTRWQSQSAVQIDYHCEPEQNIALARNKAVENARGSLIAFIDDDEWPERTWLLHLYKTMCRFRADAVLGPVRPHYSEDVPKWLIRSKLCERPSHETGTRLRGSETRTGNVLLRRSMVESPGNRFDPAFGRTGGEDTNLFRRMEKTGRVYVWCEEAPVHETVPPERWSAGFYIRRASRVGTLAGTRIRTSHLLRHFAYSFVKSASFLAGGVVFLPLSRLFGTHNYVRMATKVAYNFALLSSLLGRPAIHRDEARSRGAAGTQRPA